MNQPARKAPPGPRPPPYTESQRETIVRCLEKLKAAAAIRISHTDSDSRVEALNAERVKAMHEVITELQALT